VTFETPTHTRQDIIKRLDALEKDNAELRGELIKRPYKTVESKPGMKPDENNIRAKFYHYAKNNQGYTIDPYATMELHDWKPEEIVETEWAKSSVQHRVKVSLLNLAGKRSGKKQAFTVEEWFENYVKQGELDV
jgi:hypothetical protein